MQCREWAPSNGVPVGNHVPAAGEPAEDVRSSTAVVDQMDGRDDAFLLQHARYGSLGLLRRLVQQTRTSQLSKSAGSRRLFARYGSA